MDFMPDNPPAMADVTPEPTTELISDEDALALINKTYADYDHGRKPFERQWYRNILFLLGNQWIIWDTLENKWRKKRLADWVPTPVTNKFASAGQRLVSVLARIEPNWNFVPASDSADDIAASEKCKDAEDVICEENDIAKIRQSIAPWAVYTGNCFLLSGVESSKPKPATSETTPPFMQTSLDTTMPPNQPEGTLQPSIDMGFMAPPMEPQDYKLYTDVLAPFEVYLDQTIENFNDQVKVMVVNRRSKEYVKNLWGEDIDDLDVAPNIHYQESIGYITSSPEITGFLASLSRIKRVTIKRLFHRPTPDYPEGLYIVAAGSKILEKKPLPKTVEGEAFVPLAQIKFDNIPGAAFGRTPMDDIVHKQIQRNKIESLVELIALRMGSPIWLMPEGTVLRNFTGAPGAVINYSLVGDKASAPSRIPGEQVPSSIVQFIANIDKDIEDLVSTFEALKGQSPYSGAPGVVIEQLIEQGLTRFGPSLRNVAEGYRSWMKHQLELFRVYGISDKTVMKMGEGSKWVATKFKGSDIMGAVDVRIESDSTVPRSSQVEIAKILEAIPLGLVNIQDPNVRLKVLQKLHIPDLNDNIQQDQLSAVKENEQFAQVAQMAQDAARIGFPPPPVPDVAPFLDNHVVHIYEHKQFANSDAGAQVKPLLIQHITKHRMIMDAEMNGQAMGNPTPGSAPGMAGPGKKPLPTTKSKVPPEAAKALNPGQTKTDLPPGIA